jgi:hypothetical protein
MMPNNKAATIEQTAVANVRFFDILNPANHHHIDCYTFAQHQKPFLDFNFAVAR